MEGYEYKIGQRPPELAEDGSFKIPLGLRGYNIVDDEGRILTVDKATGLLVELQDTDDGGDE